MQKFSVRDSNIIKGVAIIMMVYHHLFRLPEFSKGYLLSFFPFTIKRVAQITTFFKLCVPLFVFISGYGLLYCYKKLKKKENFFIIRFLKLMPIFWIVAILSCIFLQIQGHYISNTFFQKGLYSGIAYLLFDILGISSLLGTPTVCNNWWYIGASIIFIFLIPIIYNLAKKYGWFRVGLGIVLIPRILNLDKISTTSALPFIFVLFLGMYAQDTDLLEKIKNFKLFFNKHLNIILKFLIYIILFLISYLFSSHVPKTIFWEIHFGFIPLIFISFIYEFIAPRKFIAKILEILGKYSYIMYLIHGFIFQLYGNFIYGAPHFLLSGIYVILISFLISFITIQILKHVRYEALFQKIAKKYE